MRVVLGISGGIAAYKTPDLVRRLRDVGAEVRVLMTPNAARFVTPLALATVSGHGVIVEQWGDPERGGVDHVELARWAELLLIAPATANVLAKLAVGIADDALVGEDGLCAHRGRRAARRARDADLRADLAHAAVRHQRRTGHDGARDARRGDALARRRGRRDQGRRRGRLRAGRGSREQDQEGAARRGARAHAA